jgi:hypothetical protein
VKKTREKENMDRRGYSEKKTNGKENMDGCGCSGARQDWWPGTVK